MSHNQNYQSHGYEPRKVYPVNQSGYYHYDGQYNSGTFGSRGSYTDLSKRYAQDK